MKNLDITQKCISHILSVVYKRKSCVFGGFIELILKCGQFEHTSYISSAGGPLILQ